MALCLGRKPRLYRNVPHYSAVLQRASVLPQPPAEIHYGEKITNFGMMMNDVIGDCTCAGINHARQIWTSEALFDMRTTPDAYVEYLYEQVGGYIPGNASTDNGAAEQTVLTYCCKPGIPIAPGAVNKLSAFLEIDPRLQNDVVQAIWECALVYIGFNVPAYLMNDLPRLWDVSPSADQTIVGGHCVILPGYKYSTMANGGIVYDVISWGARYQMTGAFWNTYVDEAYALIDPGWVSYSGKTPGGFTIDELEALMENVVG